MHDFFEELGIKDSDIPPGQTRETLLARAVGDNFFFNRVLKDLVIAHANETASRLNKLERDAMRNRLIPKIEKHPVVWGMIMPDQNTRGVMVITATRGAETHNWQGDYRQVQALRLFGEPVPGDIAELYRLHNAAPKSDPTFYNEKKQQERWAAEDAQKKQGQRLSPEEIMVVEQFRVNPGTR